MAKVTINKAAMRKIERQVSARLSGIQWDRTKTEREQIAEIEVKVRAAGFEPNHDEIRRLVRGPK